MFVVVQRRARGYSCSLLSTLQFASWVCCSLPLQQEECCLPEWTPHWLHLLCGSLPISICGCANDDWRDKSERKLEFMRDGNKSAYRSLNEAADGCADAWASGFVYPHGATEIEEGKAIMAAYPVCRVSISVFPGSLPSPAWISLLIIQTADFLKMVPIWFQPPPALLFGCIWRRALPSAST